MTITIIIASVSALVALAAIAEIRNRAILKAEEKAAAKTAAKTAREITSKEIWDAVAEKREIIRTLDRAAAAKKW